MTLGGAFHAYSAVAWCRSPGTLRFSWNRAQEQVFLEPSERRFMPRGGTIKLSVPNALVVRRARPGQTRFKLIARLQARRSCHSNLGRRTGRWVPLLGVPWTRLRRYSKNWV